MIRFSTTAALCASATLLAGCSWMPFGGGAKAHHGHQAGHYAPQGPALGLAPGHCQVPHAQAPIPVGCDPASVTVGLGAFPQSPQFDQGYGGAGYGAPGHGGAAYADAGYGSHAAGAHLAAVPRGPFGEAPVSPWGGSKFRTNFSLGIEKSVAGDYLDYAKLPGIDPELAYNPALYTEGSQVGSPETGLVTTTTFYAIPERFNKPGLSQDDIHSTPLQISAGGEYALSPRTSVFGQVGYGYSEGNEGDIISIDAELRRRVDREFYEEREIRTIDPMTGEVTDIRREIVALGTDSAEQFVPNVAGVAAFSASATDLRRLDLQAGARHYFDTLDSQGLKRVKPFVAASAGASHINAQRLSLRQRQAFLERSFEDQSTAGNTYEVVPSDVLLGTVEISDSQWVPRGELNAGLEWQTSPRTALAFETGVRVEGGRKYSSGERADTNVSIPLTLRGSFNF